MKAIADALVYAVTYINRRGGDGEFDDDDDAGALESIAGMLHSATAEERKALATAAEKALTDELAGEQRDEFVREYRAWMEEMFGAE